MQSTKAQLLFKSQRKFVYIKYNNLPTIYMPESHFFRLRDGHAMNGQIMYS